MLEFNLIVMSLIIITLVLTIEKSCETYLSASVNEFGVSLMKQLFLSNDGKENILISPMSVSAALTIIYHGSEGNTQTELHKALKYGDLNVEEIKHMWAQWLEPNAEAKNELTIANKILISKQFNVLDSYKDLLRSYRANFSHVDRNNSNQVLKNINRWVKKLTHEKVDKFLDKVDPKAKIIILNTIYFKGLWENSFNAKKSKRENFKNFGKSIVKIAMMKDKRFLMHHHIKELNSHMIELPYAGLETNMYIILPQKADGFIQVIKSLTTKIIDKSIESMEGKEVNIWLPKFHMLSKYSMGAHFKKMGIKSIFVPKQANLRQISSKKGLSLSKFVHKGIVEIDEHGSTASDITGGSITARMASFANRKKESVLNFRVEHPFIFLIKDTTINVLLIIGAVLNV